MYETKYARVSQANVSWIRCAASNHCQRSAIGSAVTTMIATESANHHGSASSSTSTVCCRSIFQTRYATARPVRIAVAPILTGRLTR